MNSGYPGAFTLLKENYSIRSFMLTKIDQQIQTNTLEQIANGAFFLHEFENNAISFHLSWLFAAGLGRIAIKSYELPVEKIDINKYDSYFFEDNASPNQVNSPIAKYIVPLDALEAEFGKYKKTFKFLVGGTVSTDRMLDEENGYRFQRNLR